MPGGGLAPPPGSGLIGAGAPSLALVAGLTTDVTLKPSARSPGITPGLNQSLGVTTAMAVARAAVIA
jgi:hypothetical protein